MENVLLQNKAAAAIPEEEVDAVIAENQLAMEEVELYHIRVEDEDTAQEIKALLDEDENFLALAWEHSQDEETRKKGGYIGLLGREDMLGDIEAAVFSAEPGAIIGPMKTEAGYNIFKVEQLVKPDREDPKLREEIKMELLNEKIGTLLDKADIECSLFE
jgi:parvulin-like peptidyl-prolyl isomerase